MRAVGVLLLVLGIVGLLLNLILWFPVGFNLIIVALVSAVCFVAIWGGGRLYQARTDVVKELVQGYEPMGQKPHGGQMAIICPRCGSSAALGYRFCGACGSNLVSCCPACGAAVTDASRFCGNCGARLS